MGMDVVMLTGDNKKSGMAIARKTRIKNFQAEVTPQNKAEILHQLQQGGNKVIMVGDGINDAPALAVANVGVALGTGSDIAIESGDVTIIKGDLERLVDAIMLSKKTMTNIKQNLFWAFLYNIFMIPLAILGFLAPWLAGATMAFSSISVVLNSLRLKRIKI
jgi:Cu+-exporting ATPase